MEILTLLVPFFLLGFVAAGIARLSGVAMSMLIVPAVLIWGGTAQDVISFMFLFVLYNNFTIATQDVRLDYKDLVFFSRWKMAIPLLLTLVLTFFFPAAGVAFFIACFILELAAAVFNRIPEQQRPSWSDVAVQTVITVLLVVLGATVAPLIPSDVYFGLAGLSILCISVFAWYAANYRNAFRSTWAYIWSAFGFFLGAFGIEASTYPEGTQRTFQSKVDAMVPMITVIGAFGGMVYIFATQFTFSIPAFIAAIGAALGVRLFGIYEFPKRGSFSYLAIGFAVLAVICLYLVSPVPTGFSEMDAVLATPIIK